VQREVVLMVEGAVADSFSDALLDAGALSVSVEDADADREDEQPLYGEPGQESDHKVWKNNRVVLLIDASTDVAELIAAAAAAIDRPVPLIIDEHPINETDWVRLTQSQFAPTQIDARLWIVPTWHEPPDPYAINIRLDPGVAFGTGTHPTTRLCLAWLAQADLRGRRVLDFGCGSGILAIASAKLGARAVDGTDIDAQALDAARANSRLNDITARYTAPSEIDGVYDVVLANVLANPLKILAPALLSRLAPAGQLVLSGILDRQAQDVIDAYVQHDRDISMSVWRSDGGWSCVVGQRGG
jgi:ribosomal protein L11 methyltransferase